MHGTQEAPTARLHRSQGWVSQRLALLTLTPELKEKLQSDEESAALLRRFGKNKAEEQETHLRRLKEKATQEAADKKARAEERKAGSRKQPADKPAEGDRADQSHYGVINGAPRPRVPNLDQLLPSRLPSLQQHCPSHAYGRAQPRTPMCLRSVSIPWYGRR
ncbi:hypothetical protein ACFU6I_45380 [Streptomyces sp. NPDC057486]|uniref:hypothetical protein n=1 Tax=Streptomyces sp. NPDC057486 TaxID=3346145 RepID=UPI0036AECC3F